MGQSSNIPWLSVARMATEEAPTSDPPPEDTGEGEEEEEVQLPPPCMDLTGFPLKVDIFDNMQMLDEKAEKIEGAANFRQVAGFPVFATGQPTEEGVIKVLEKMIEEGKDKLEWY